MYYLKGKHVGNTSMREEGRTEKRKRQKERETHRERIFPLLTCYSNSRIPCG
jgi:hypothetical protein